MVTLAAVGKEVSLGRSAHDAPLPFPANLSDTAVLADGSVVAVTLRQTSTDGWALFQQRFSADGAALDPIPVRVASADAFGSPEVIALDGGGFVVAWTETAPGAGPARSQAAYAVYDANGSLLRVDTLGRFDHGVSVTGAAAPGGGFTLGWAGGHGQAAPHFLAQSFDAGGAAAGRQTVVSTHAAATDPVLVPIGDGAYLAMWGDHGRFFDGRGFGPELALQRVVDGVWGGMDAVRLASGDVAVVWSEVTASGYLPQAQAQAFLQVFDPETGTFGPRALLTGASGFQLVPNVVALEDGGMAVTWRYGDSDGHTEVGLYDADGTARGVQRVQGDFVGVDDGQILATRLDSDGGLWLQRYTTGEAIAHDPVENSGRPVDPPAPQGPPEPAPVQEAPAPAPADLFQFRGEADAAFDRSASTSTVALQGSARGDVVRGGAAADALDGAAGDDDLHGGAGADRVKGGAGDDVFVFRAGDLVGAGGAVDHVVDFHAFAAADATGERDSLAFVGFGADARLVFHHYGQRGGVVDQRLQYYELTDGAQAFLILVQVAGGTGPLSADDYAFFTA